MEFKVAQKGPRRNYWNFLLNIAIRTYRQRFSVADQRIDIDADGIGCIAYSFLLVRAIYVQPLKSWAIGVETIPIWFNDDGELETQLPFGSSFASRVSG